MAKNDDAQTSRSLRLLHQLHVGDLAVAEVLEQLELELEDRQRRGVQRPDALLLETDGEGFLHGLPRRVARKFLHLMNLFLRLVLYRLRSALSLGELRRRVLIRTEIRERGGSVADAFPLHLEAQVVARAGL